MTDKDCVYKTSVMAQKVPNKIAVIDSCGIKSTLRTTSFQMLEQHISALHAYFDFHGIGPGSYVAVDSKNRCEILEIFLAAFRVGAIPYIVSQHIDGEMNDLFERMPPDLLFLEELSLLSTYRSFECLEQTIFILLDENKDRWEVKNFETKLESYNRLKSVRGGQLVHDYTGTPQYITLTSAPIMSPKAVVRAFVAPPLLPLSFSGITLYDEEKESLEVTDIYALSALYSIEDAIVKIQNGLLVLLLPKFEPNIYLQLLEQYQPRMVLVPAGHLSQCVRLAQNWLGRFDGIRLIAVCGDPCSSKVMQAARELFGCAVISKYMVAEGDPGFTFSGVALADLPANCVGKAPHSGGIKLLNQHGEEGDYGELHFNNGSLFVEYYDNIELTEQKLVNGWFATGDWFRRGENGLYYFQGRNEAMLSRDGEIIFPLEIESVLMEYPGVREACVVVYPRDGVNIPLAMVILDDKYTSICQRDLFEFCAGKGLGQAVPQWISFSEYLPVLSSGKIDRRKIARIICSSFIVS